MGPTTWPRRQDGALTAGRTQTSTVGLSDAETVRLETPASDFQTHFQQPRVRRCGSVELHVGQAAIPGEGRRGVEARPRPRRAHARRDNPPRHRGLTRENAPAAGDDDDENDWMIGEEEAAALEEAAAQAEAMHDMEAQASDTGSNVDDQLHKLWQRPALSSPFDGADEIGALALRAFCLHGPSARALTRARARRSVPVTAIDMYTAEPLRGHGQGSAHRPPTRARCRSSGCAASRPRATRSCRTSMASRPTATAPRRSV